MKLDQVVGMTCMCDPNKSPGACNLFYFRSNVNPEPQNPIIIELEMSSSRARSPTKQYHSMRSSPKSRFIVLPRVPVKLLPIHHFQHGTHQPYSIG